MYFKISPKKFDPDNTESRMINADKIISVTLDGKLNLCFNLENGHYLFFKIKKQVLYSSDSLLGPWTKVDVDIEFYMNSENVYSNKGGE